MRAETVGLEVVGTSGGEQLVKCPFHDDHHASATWNPKSDLFYCFTCGFGMNAEQLINRTGYDVDVEMIFENREWTPDIDLSNDDLLKLPTEFHYTKYLAGRGISKATAEKYDIRTADSMNRITFPSKDIHGKNNGMIVRYIHPGIGPRYRKVGEQYPIWPMPELLKIKPGSVVIVTEGIFSCLRINSVSDYLPVFSLCGAKANKDIAATLSPFNPVIIYDDDRAGKRAAARMKNICPDWKIFVSNPAPDDMEDNNQITNLVNKILVLMS